MAEQIHVRHAQFGDGTVEVLDQAHIRVHFEGGTARVFGYPEAFERFLTTDDADFAAETQQRLEVCGDARRAREEAARKQTLECRERIYREALETKKKPASTRRKAAPKTASKAKTTP